MATHRVHISAYPLGANEPVRVIAAIHDAWLPPAWASRRLYQGAWLVEAQMEAALPAGDDEAAFSRRVSIAVWQRLGRYVKVAIDTAAGECDETHYELGRRDYVKWMRLDTN